MISSTKHVCLECGNEFLNTLDLAICSSCLEIERKNNEKGIRSKYFTVDLYLKGIKYKIRK